MHSALNSPGGPTVASRWPDRLNQTSSAPGAASRYASTPVFEAENSAWKVTGL